MNGFRVDMGVMVMKGYSTFPKAPELKLFCQIQSNAIFRTLIGEVRFYSFAEMSVAYFTASTNNAAICKYSLKKGAHEFVLNSPAVPNMTCLF